MSKIEFITTPFFLSHGKEPKGKGCWAFSLDKKADAENIFFTKSMLYSEAKKEAKKHFKALNEEFNSIYVLG